MAPVPVPVPVLTAQAVAGGGRRLTDLRLVAGNLHWLETRPEEAGRTVLMRKRPGEQPEEMTPAPFSVRTAVHEYGGAAYTLDSGGCAYVSSGADGRLYRLAACRLEPLTPLGSLRYADMVLDPVLPRLVTVVEKHHPDDVRDGSGVRNRISAIDLEDGSETVIVSGADFYAAPRLSRDGRRLTWLSWNQPDMPWDGTELWVADLDSRGIPERSRLVAGGAAESIYQPEWSPDDQLHFVSDRSGWWNLYLSTDDGGVEPVAPMSADCGRPQWAFGMSNYAFADAERIVVAAVRSGRWSLAVIRRGGHLSEDSIQWLDTPFTDIDRYLVADQTRLVTVAGHATLARSIVDVSLSDASVDIIRRSNAVVLDPSSIAPPETITYPARDGGRAYGFLYRPTGGVQPGVKPPLLVRVHGGPTGAANTALDLGIQWWTTRGFAFFDVNFGGSTGYGRAYRERLNGQFGVVDVNDCVDGAQYLAARGDVDPARLFIAGGSSGGYVVLAALAFHDLFAAGSCHYGIGDLEALATELHKFEARYFDGLVGPFPEHRALYRERSPLHHVDRINTPVIFFHGLEDTVVPPSQATTMCEALRRRGVATEAILFEGEGHGFRQAATVERILEAEFRFFGAVPVPEKAVK